MDSTSVLSASASPSIPNGHQGATSRNGAGQGQGHSPSLAQRRQFTRSNRDLRVQPASQDVIASLITTLSQISAPANNMFEEYMDTPTSKAFRDLPDYAVPSQSNEANGSQEHELDTLDNGLNYDAILRIANKRLDEAGFQNVKSTNGNVESPRRKNKYGGPATESTTALRDSTFGALSIERGNSALSSRSNGSMRERGYRASKERMKEIDRDLKRKAKAFRMANAMDGGPLSAAYNSHRRAKARTSIIPDVPPLPESQNVSPVTPQKGFLAPIGLKNGDTSGDESPDRAKGAAPRGVGGGLSAWKKDKDRTPTSNGAVNGNGNGSETLSQTMMNDKVNERGEGDKEIRPPPRVVLDSADAVEQRILELKEKKRVRDLAQQEEDMRAAVLLDYQGPLSTSAAPAAPSNPEPKPTASPNPNDRTFSMASNTSKSLKAPASNMPASLLNPSSSGKRSLDAARSSSMKRKLTDSRTHKKNLSASLPRKSNNFDEDASSFADSIDDAVDEYITNSRLSQLIYHPETGREIAFSEVGDPDGNAIFCCVGMGTTRYLTAYYDELALTLGLRLITLDRPGIGGSEAFKGGPGPPLHWPDDVRLVCQHLGITRFSLLAHSAGAIYALAVALRMPQHVQGNVHLLAPWIPPSQMIPIGLVGEPVPNTSLPYSQRILRSIPTPFLKVANSKLFAVTSSSIATSLPKSPKRTQKRRKEGVSRDVRDGGELGIDTSPANVRVIDMTNTTNGDSNQPLNIASSAGPVPNPGAIAVATAHARSPSRAASRAGSRPPTSHSERSMAARLADYDVRLTHTIWHFATLNSNPAIDLLVCLERLQPIGFRYEDITRPVVVHHGSRDNRVPVQNAQWMARRMRKCQVRILKGEGHGLMASAKVMGELLVEMSKEWREKRVAPSEFIP